MRSRAFGRPVRVLVALVLGAAVVSACGSNAANPKAAPTLAPKPTTQAPATVAGYQVTQLKMEDATGYVPKSINGGTDDYHCTLVNPNVTQNSFIVSSQFFPGSGKSVAEVHHAIMFLVPPALA